MDRTDCLSNPAPVLYMLTKLRTEKFNEICFRNISGIHSAHSEGDVVLVYRLVVEIYQLEGYELYDSLDFPNIVLSLCMYLAFFQSDNDEVFPNLYRQEYELSAVNC